MLIHDKFYCEGFNNYNKFRDIAERLSKRQCVEFASYCAKDVFHLVNEEHKENAKLCLDLVEKWLNGESSVTSNAYAAYYVAWAAAYAVFANPNKLNEYLIVANSYLTTTNTSCPNYEIKDKILFLINELDENIIVHKDKYYINMNGIENCPEYGFNTQQELLNELLNSKDQFWEFARNWLDQLYKNQQA